MSPALSGIWIPVMVILVLMAIPYVERRPEDVGIWFASRKGRNLCMWACVYTVIADIGLVLFDRICRCAAISSGLRSSCLNGLFH